MNGYESIEVREAVDSDAEAIAVVQVEAWRSAYVGILPEKMIESFTVELRRERWRQILNEESGMTFVASIDEEIAAWSGFGVSRDDDRTTSAAEIFGFYVAPGYWRQGIGKKLWQETVAQISKLGFRTADLWVLSENQPARRFYEAMGCRLDSHMTKMIDCDGQSIPKVRYNLAL